MNIDENGPDKYNRREFLRGALMTLMAGSLVMKEDRTEGVEKKKKTYPEEWVMKKRSEELYVEKYNGLEKQDVNLINSILFYQKQRDISLEKEFSPNEIIKKRENIWKKISKDFPEIIKGEYTEKKFFHFLIEFLPNYLAKKGVVIFYDFPTVVNRDKILWTDLNLNFVAINEVGEVNLKFKTYNKKFRAQCCFIEPLIVNGKNYTNMDKIEFAGTMDWKTIFLNMSVIRGRVEENVAVTDDVNQLVKKTDEELWRICNNTEDRKKIKMIALARMAKIDKNLVSDLEDIKLSVIVHESGHILDQENQHLSSLFADYKDCDSYRDNFDYQFYRECGVLLFELRETDKKDFLFKEIIRCYGKEINQNKGITSNACAYLGELIIDEISRDSKKIESARKYKKLCLHIEQETSDEKSKYKILVQFSDFLKTDESREELNNVLDDIRCKYYESRLWEKKTLNRGCREVDNKNKKIIQWCGVWPGLTLLTTGLALKALAKVIDRKEEMKKK